MTEQVVHSISSEKLIKHCVFVLIALIVGLCVGCIDALFGRVLIAIGTFRDAHVWLLLPFLGLAGLCIVCYYRAFGRGSERGMSLVFEAGHGEASTIPLRLIPCVGIGTWITHLFGGSAGREGVAVQIGATFSHWLAGFVADRFPNLLPKLDRAEVSQLFLVVGIAAGFSGLFQTPIASVFFALEVLVVGKLRHEALLPAVVSAFTASFCSHALGLEKFSFVLSDQVIFDVWTLLKLALLGLLLGLLGALFSYSLAKGKLLAKRFIRNPFTRILVIGILVSCLLLLCYQGRYAGLGTNLIAASLNLQPIYSWDWILKLALTVLTLSAGFQGGEVTPLFSIGASFGAVMAAIFGLPLPFVAALGYAGLFGSASNTLLAPILIGGEVFGFSYLPYFFIVCSFAYISNFNLSIYDKQKKL